MDAINRYAATGVLHNAVEPLIKISSAPFPSAVVFYYPWIKHYGPVPKELRYNLSALNDFGELVTI